MSSSRGETISTRDTRTARGSTELFAQFPEVEELLTLAGFEVWPQIEHEADDAMAAAAAQAAADDRVEQVVICTPDKDLAQCVTADGRVIQFDRRREIVYDRDGVIAVRRAARVDPRLSRGGR